LEDLPGQPVGPPVCPAQAQHHRRTAELGENLGGGLDCQRLRGLRRRAAQPRPVRSQVGVPAEDERRRQPDQPARAAVPGQARSPDELAALPRTAPPAVPGDQRPPGTASSLAMMSAETRDPAEPTG
jgi:hypothetical protein